MRSTRDYNISFHFLFKIIFTSKIKYKIKENNNMEPKNNRFKKKYREKTFHLSTCFPND